MRSHVAASARRSPLKIRGAVMLSACEKCRWLSLPFSPRGLRLRPEMGSSSRPLQRGQLEHDRLREP